VPEPYLSYLNSAADGVNPFVYIKADGLVLSLVDAARHDLGGVDVAMTVPDTFPLGTYTVQGVVRDLAGNETTVTLILIVTGDRVEPVVDITAATADGVAMAGDLATGYILPTTNDPAIDHLLQIAATVDAPLADEYSGLYFVEAESTVSTAELQAYYAARGVPTPYLEYLNGAADGTNPFVFIKEAGLSLSLVDAAKHTIQGTDVDMTVPDDFPLGTYVVRGVVADAAGNETTVTLILIVTGDRVEPTITSITAFGAEGFDDVVAVGTTLTVDQGYTVDYTQIVVNEPVTVTAGTVVNLAGQPYGTITVDATGLILTITPYPGNEIANLVGSFVFSVPAGSIEDLAGNALETLSLTLVVNNVAPVAVDDAYSTNEDVALIVAAPGVLTNDTDFDPAILTAVLVTGPSNGTLTLNANGSFTYTPAANFYGTDTFTYKANDGLADSNVATVTITVTSVNDSPVLGPIADATIPELVEFSFTATATDADLPVQELTFSLVGAPDGAVITETGVFTWTPSELQGPGVYTFTVKVCDDATPALCDEQEVTLTVTEVNVAPVAQDLTATTPEETPVDVTLVATDAEGDELTYAIVDQPAHGTVTMVGTTATYTPELDFNGEDSFTYKANDGLVDSNVATVTITVTAVNDAPVAVDDDYTVAEKETLTITAPGVLANDSDVDGDALSAILVDTVSNGSLTLNADGSFTYEPDEYFNGTDSFTYKASDGLLESDLAVVTITVTPVNDWPIANDDFYETVTGVLLDVAAPGVLANDVLLDPDEEVSIQILDEPQHGTLSMNDDGSFTYTPNAGFMGTDTFRYQVNSVQLHAEWSDEALVTIVVKPFMSLFLPIILR
jgi:VCBS repeat-containing protein